MLRDEQLLKENMEIMQLIFKGQPLNKVLSKIIENIEERFHLHSIKAVVIHACSREKKLFKLASSSPSSFNDNFTKPIKIGSSRSFIGKAASLQHAIISTPHKAGKENLKETEADDEDQTDLHEQYKTALSVPIISTRDQLIGTLTIFYHQVYEPSMEDSRVIEFYCKLIAVAIELLNDVENKRNQTEMYLPLTDKVPHETLGILLQLKNALHNNQFTIFYQPIYDINLKLLGFEALLRWHHPQSGLLPPAKFLEVAEATGFIIQMEDWVLEHSIAEINNIRKGPLKNLRLAVNISAKQLERKDFVDHLRKILAKYTYEPKHLTLEITERFLMKERNIQVIQQIKDLGVRLAIDDFGTSYSSLQYLKYLPVDEIKIDRSFIMDLDSNENSKIIVEMIVKLAHQLNVTIVGEGVETPKQLEMLRQMNCDQVQGFLFSRPIPLEEIIRSNVVKISER